MSSSRSLRRNQILRRWLGGLLVAASAAGLALGARAEQLAMARPAPAPRAVEAAAGETYQTFEMASALPDSTLRLAVACLAPEDRVVDGACVRRDAAGYRSFAARPATAGGADAIECTIEVAANGAASSAVGIAVCEDLPPLR
jgi:hypothetical protein